MNPAKKIHIRIITPHTTPRPAKLGELNGLLPEASVMFSHVGLEAGPPSIQSHNDEASCAPHVVLRCIEAERDGVDAVIIDCFGDPGLDAAREAVSIVVLGPGETCMRIAGMLGHRFGIVTVLDRLRPMLENNARKYGTFERLACVRSVNTPVLEIDDKLETITEALFDQSVAAIIDDKADVIILGCTGFLGVSDQLEERLKARQLPAPVMNPLRTTATMAFALVSAGLSTSVLAFPPPIRAK